MRVDMQKRSWIINIITFLTILLAIIGFVYLKPFFSNEVSHTHSEADAGHEEAFKRGPHRGRLLEKNSFQVEVTIYEPEGTPPKFRIYFYDKGVPVNPSEVTYEMELKRINRLEKVPFAHKGDFLESTIEASEPHSFDVAITAKYKDETHSWSYQTYEGRVELTPEAIKANNIKVETAGPINLEIKLDVMGRIIPNEELTVHISPRFPGVVKSVNKKLGDVVQKGEVLAVIESNESLKNYEIKSEMHGMVIKKDINPGMYLSGQENVFVISDLSSVWADFNIYLQDLSRINIGDPIEIISIDGNLKQQSTISYISPIGHESTQSVIARATLNNPKEEWRPGLFISGEITVDNDSLSVAVKDGALQTFRDWDVIFISNGNVFEVAPVKTGRRNKEWVEIKSGISPGDQYVSENSFIIEADIEKSSAAHEH
jgi:cobalt-zinc-cadmium efflux system membrane fusion protein